MREQRFIVVMAAILLVLPEARAFCEDAQRFVLEDYELSFRKADDEGGYWAELKRAGRVLVEVEPGACFMSDPVGVVADKPARGCASLVGYCFSGGAHCCTTGILLTVCPSRRDVKTLSLAHSGAFQWEDADGDGIDELVVPDWSFAYYAVNPDDPADLFLPFAFSPAFRRLLVWDEEGWRVDRPGEFAGIYGALRKEAVEEAQRASAQRDPEGSVGPALSAAYYAFMGGRGEDAVREILKKYLPPDWREFSGSIRKDLRSSVEGFDPFETERPRSP